jgi:hypothetical protein
MGELENLKVVFLTYVFVQRLFVFSIYKKKYVDCEFLITLYVVKIKTNKWNKCNVPKFNEKVKF